jgi:uncharacterized damage-inducible protein DinB
MNDDIKSALAYNRWAEGRVLDACRKLSPQQYAAEPMPGWSSVRASVVHIISATQNWVRRLAGETTTGAIAEAELPTVDDAERRLEQVHKMLDALLPTMTPEWLSTPRPIQFRDRCPAIPPWAVLRHMVNHATYHRGQVSSKLKRHGVEPPSTDLIFWAVEQMPPPA